MKKIFFCLILSYFSIFLFSQEKTIYLWNDVEQMKNQKTVLFAHTPKNQNNKIAVIICPGGSYHHLGLYNEGNTSAKWFTQNGITAFVLKYRTNQNGYNHPAMLEDIQKAILYVRQNASEYSINPQKIGVIGFSAGGHLVTMAGAFCESKNELKKFNISINFSIKPDFVIPVYPVVSMQDDICHKWSRKSLLGKNPSQKLKDEFSMELNIPKNMVPTFIVVAKDDKVVDYNNSLRLYDALQKQNIKNCRLTVYQWGNHGFGMKNNNFMKTFHWNDEILLWLKQIGILNE